MTTKKKDWRSLPRKPADKLANRSIAIRATDGEREAMSSAAKEHGMTMRDFVLTKCLGKIFRNSL